VVKGIQSFLNLANFYQKFIKGFSQMMKALLDLLKKSYLLNGKRSNKGHLKT
jgi:hypothetical protein